MIRVASKTLTEKPENGGHYKTYDVIPMDYSESLVHKVSCTNEQKNECIRTQSLLLTDGIETFMVGLKYFTREYRMLS